MRPPRRGSGRKPAVANARSATAVATELAWVRASDGRSQLRVGSRSARAIGEDRLRPRTRAGSGVPRVVCRARASWHSPRSSGELSAPATVNCAREEACMNDGYTLESRALRGGLRNRRRGIQRRTGIRPRRIRRRGGVRRRRGIRRRRGALADEAAFADEGISPTKRKGNTTTRERGKCPAAPGGRCRDCRRESAVGPVQGWPPGSTRHRSSTRSGAWGSRKRFPIGHRSAQRIFAAGATRRPSRQSTDRKLFTSE